MEFDGKIPCHEVICTLNTVKIFEKPSRFFVEIDKTDEEVWKWSNLTGGSVLKFQP